MSSWAVTGESNSVNFYPIFVGSPALPFMLGCFAKRSALAYKPVLGLDKQRGEICSKVEYLHRLSKC